MRERKYDVGPGFVRAKECPDCFHTRCGEDCTCNCDAAHAEHEAATLREQLREEQATIERLRGELAERKRESEQFRRAAADSAEEECVLSHTNEHKDRKAAETECKRLRSELATVTAERDELLVRVDLESNQSHEFFVANRDDWERQLAEVVSRVRQSCVTDGSGWRRVLAAGDYEKLRQMAGDKLTNELVPKLKPAPTTPQATPPSAPEPRTLTVEEAERAIERGECVEARTSRTSYAVFKCIGGKLHNYRELSKRWSETRALDSAAHAVRHWAEAGATFTLVPDPSQEHEVRSLSDLQSTARELAERLASDCAIHWGHVEHIATAIERALAKESATLRAENERLKVELAEANKERSSITAQAMDLLFERNTHWGTEESLRAQLREAQATIERVRAVAERVANAVDIDAADVYEQLSSALASAKQEQEVRS